MSNWQGEYKNVSAKTYIASRKCFFPQNIKKSRHNCKKTLNKRFFGLATTSRLQCAGVSPGLGWSSEKMPVSSWASALVLSAPSVHTATQSFQRSIVFASKLWEIEQISNLVKYNCVQSYTNKPKALMVLEAQLTLGTEYVFGPILINAQLELSELTK